MNEIQVFKNGEFGEVRTLVVNNEPMFVGRDVALALGYKDTVNALKSHVDEEDKKGWQITTPSRGTQNATVINESGVYSLVFSSKLPDAKKFKHWVTSEVLPSIRKHGAYMTEQTLNKALTSPDFLIQLATQLKTEQEKLAEAKNEIARQHDRIGTLEGHLKYNMEEVKKLTPDAEYTRKTLTSTTSWNTNVIAKEIGMSAVTLNKRLQGLGIQYKEHGVWVLTHKYQNERYTKTNTYNYPKSDGTLGTRIQTEWTEKGRRFIHELYDKGRI
nr:MAG TPA: repressor domain protein [Caudoviricetes sp.]